MLKHRHPHAEHGGAEGSEEQIRADERARVEQELRELDDDRRRSGRSVVMTPTDDVDERDERDERAVAVDDDRMVVVEHGPNTGHAVLHSGTVGAALTAATFGVRALAVSIATGRPTYWDTAAAIAGLALDWLLDTPAPTVLNVNVPNIPLDELTGFEQVKLAAFGAVQTTVTETGAGYVKLAYEDVDADLEPGTDAAALANGAACYTPLRAACEAPDDDTVTLAERFTARREVSRS